MIIAISGKKQSGKDTVGKILQYFTIPKEHRTITIHEWMELASTVYTPEIIGDTYMPTKKFATKLKEISAYLLDTPSKNFESDDFKNTTLSELWKVFTVNYSDGLCSHNKLFNKFQDAYEFFSQCTQIGFTATEPIEKLMTYRDFLIQLGTDGGREQVHPNIWVYTTFSEYTPKENWIITDMRFKNELDFVKKLDSYIIRVDRDGLPPNDSVTETQLDDSYQEFDCVINNSDSIEDLMESIEDIISSEERLKPLFYV